MPLLEPPALDIVLSEWLTSIVFRGTDAAWYGEFDIPGKGNTILLLEAEDARFAMTRHILETCQLIVSDSDIRKAVRGACALACTKPDRKIFLRMGVDDDARYIDLHSEPRRYVRFNADRWDVVDEVPVAFVSGLGQLPMREPRKGVNLIGGLNKLRNLLNIDQRQWRVVLVLLINYLMADQDHPVLVATGEPESSKSTLCEILKIVLDPNSMTLGHAPRTSQDLFIRVKSQWLPILDNLTHVDQDVMDSVCQICTGGAFACRTLYTNTDQTVITVRSPLLINGVNNPVPRPDVARRTVLLHLNPVTKLKENKNKETLKKIAAEELPDILGALLDLAVNVLRMQAEKTITSPKGVSIVDYGTIGLAVERLLGWPPHAFAQAYSIARATLVRGALDEFLVADPLLAYLEAFKSAGSIEVPTTRLLTELTNMTFGGEKPPRMWPATPAAFGKVIPMIAPSLRAIGWDAEPVAHTMFRGWRFTYEEPAKANDPVAAAANARPYVNAVAAKLTPPRESLRQSVRRLNQKKKAASNAN